jgi:hypothetical protein
MGKGEAITVALIGLIGVIVGSLLTYFVSSRDLDIKMIDIAVGLLKEDPANIKLQPARNWAVDIISYYSADVPLTEEARNALKNCSVYIDLRDKFGAIGAAAMAALAQQGKLPPERALTTCITN